MFNTMESKDYYRILDVERTQALYVAFTVARG
jgi:hypothetical protein